MNASLLPAPLNPLVGRERELSEVHGLFSSARLVSLTGAGGSGKTRLALEVALRAAATSRVAWVELAPLGDGDCLTDHVAAAVEARPGPGLDVTTALIAALQTQTLLVLDNCEHVVATTAVLAEALLRSCAGLRILATSREPLGIPGERLWPVPPMSLPTPEGASSVEEAMRWEAVQLFVACAREASPHFKLTAENVGTVVAICRRLDGLPLALELAAARTRVLSVAQIAQRLDDAFRLLTTGGRTSLPRHRTLRGAFDWSHALLSEAQQVLLRRLSIFAGNFGIEAVEEVCSGGILSPEEMLDTIASLVDRSLVVLDLDDDRARYRLLETVRQYAREHLRAAGEEDALRRRHAELYLDLAEALAPSLFGGAGSPELMRLVDLEHDNFRAAFEATTQGAGGVEAALRLGYALHWYWFASGLMLEGQRRLQGALRQSAGVTPVVRARAQVALGTINFWLGTPHGSVASVREATAVLREAGEPFALAYGLAVQAALELLEHPPSARAPVEEAARVVERLPVSVLSAFVLYWRGLAAQALGDFPLARQSFDRGVEIGRRLAHPPTLGHTLAARAGLELAQGRLDDAWHSLDESLRIHVRTGDRWGMVADLNLLAQTLAARGRKPDAARLLGAAIQLGGEVGMLGPPHEAVRLEALTRDLIASLGTAEYERAVAGGRQARPEALPDLLDEAGRALGEPAAADALAGTPEISPSVTRAVSIAEFMDRHPSLACSCPTAVNLDFGVGALGPLMVYRCGEACSAEGWGSARARELLVFLLLHPEGVTKEEVGLALWPEASASQVRNSFHVTLHRLRSALGNPESVRAVRGRYQLAPEVQIELDVHHFERDVRAALSDLRARRDGLPKLLEALELYRGDFLQGESAGEWHHETRDRLRQLCLEGLAVAGRTLLEAGRTAEAATIYRRWIAADDLAEEAYRQLLLCLEDLEEHHEAKRVYQNLVKLLQAELGVEPEARTKAVYERIERDARRG